MIEVRGSRTAIVRAYNLFSFFYGLTFARLEREAVSIGLARAAVRADERVLEVGIGTGAAFERLAGAVGATGQLLGVDVAPRMLAVTRKRIPDARLIQADAGALPFPNDFFDLVWSSYLLDLIPTNELTPVLREFRRVLKPGGRLLLVNLSKLGNNLTWWEQTYRLAPAALVPYLFGGCRPVQAEPFVRAAGFTQIERQFISKGLHSEIIVARKFC